MLGLQNYGGMQPIQPGKSMQETLGLIQSLGALADQRDARIARDQAAQAAQKQAEAEASRQGEIRAALDAAHKNPTAENYMLLSDLYAQHKPEIAKAFRDNWATFDAGRQQTIFKDSVAMLTALETSPEYGVKLLQKESLAAANAGNMEEVREYQTMIDTINIGTTGLQAAKDSLVLTIGQMPRGKEAIEGIAKYRDEQRAAAAEPAAIDKRLADLDLTKAQTDEVRARIRKLDAESANVAIDLAGAKAHGGLTPKDIADKEIQLNNTVNTRMANMKAAQTAYDNIKSGADMGNGVGDLAIVNSFMRQLSPGIVTEQDYKAATTSGGVYDQLKGLKAKVEAGSLLTQPQRTQFVTLSKQFMENAKKQSEDSLKGVRSLVKSYGLSEDNIFGPEPKKVVAVSADLSSMRNFLKTKWPGEAGKIDSLDLAELQSEYKNTLAGYQPTTGAATEPVRTGAW